MAFLTAWILPATTARRTQHVSLVLAGVVHIVTLVVAAGLLLLAAVCIESEELTLTLVRREFVTLVADLLEGMPLQALPVLPRVLATLIAVECGVACLALLWSPWGARDETMSASFRHALRRVWLQSTHLVQIVLLTGVVTVALVRAQTAFVRTHPFPEYDPPQTPPSVIAPGVAERAREEYERDFEVYRRRFQSQLLAWYNAAPWYAHDPSLVFIVTYFIMAAWALWALLRAIGAQRAATPIDRPPRCEACGYNLTGTAMDSVCPECGEPVARSLGADARAGALWERRADVGRWTAWRTVCLEGILQPKVLGRRIQLTSQDVAHRRFFACHLPVIFCLTFVGIGVCASIEQGGNVFAQASILADVAGLTVIGCLSAMLATVLVHLAALLPAVWYQLAGGRNLMAGSIQVACYLSGYLALGMVFAVVTGSAAITAEHSDLLRRPAGFLHVTPDDLAFLGWSVINAIYFAYYFVLVFRATAATRYANG